MSAAGSGVAGTVDGSFFRLPVWVDPRLAPGRTPQTPLGWGKWITNLGLGRSLVMSPNLVWFCISVMLYCCFPYDYGSAAVLDAGWVVRRTVLNLVVMFTYFGFWELALYKWNWSKRKFRGSWYKGEWVNTGWPTAGRLLHNMFFCTLGCLQHTAWEVLICHLHATGKLPYISDEEAFATAGDAVRVVVWCLVVPVWRGCHFYFSHRFIHMRFMYKFVHSLHHRNTDIEPFSGLAMHPIEHVLYYTCHLPSLYFRTHPIHMMFNGIHLLLSPAASHSGWEDHTQSDQFHFLHHAYFECNYGSASVPLDNAFGTFRECIGDSKRYTGEATSTHAAQPPAQSQAEPKQRPVRSYEGLCMKPQRGFGLYMCISVSILALKRDCAAPGEWRCGRRR
eukprot:TRINITY_DN17693_c0_g1_i1.p1 TRINITY_DN17693_c0_g1~~TRINITY_DN17693_c0_g1_i1.p1  ORF type:complete len:410 (+),score=82.78 TRINITY_DN17693_c0_g1_i1:57-1232(+)